MAAPRSWSALPIHMRQPGFSLATFKKCLEIYLFKKAFLQIFCDFLYDLYNLFNVLIIS